MSRSLRHHPLARKAVATLYNLQYAQIGAVIEYTAPIVVTVIPALQSFGLIDSSWWLAPFLGLFAAEYLYTRYRRGSANRIFRDQLRQVNSAFAGTIDSIAHRVDRRRDRRLLEDDAHTLAMNLLSRVEGFTRIALNLSPELAMRATLAVPHCQQQQPGGPVVDGLRIWCYDKPHENRNWTFLPLNGPVQAGAVAAYRTGTFQVIEDMRALPTQDGVVRDYRSVLSIPVLAGGRFGTRLAVVNVDVEQPKVFTEVGVKQDVIPLVSPVVNQLALVLLARREGEAYEFGR